MGSQTVKADYGTTYRVLSGFGRQPKKNWGLVKLLGGG